MQYLRDFAGLEPTFGRAAKLIAVYLKSMVVIGEARNSKLAAVAHPPIDAVLLGNMSRLEAYPHGLRAHWRQARWTRLEKDEYGQLLQSLRIAHPAPLPWWSIEEHWTVVQD